MKKLPTTSNDERSTFEQLRDGAYAPERTLERKHAVKVNDELCWYFSWDVGGDYNQADSAVGYATLVDALLWFRNKHGDDAVKRITEIQRFDRCCV